MGMQGRMPDVKVFILDVRRDQWSSDRVREQIGFTAATDPVGTILRLPQDGGQAGKDQAEQLEKLFRTYHPKILPVTGKKATRARGFSEAVNKGNVWLVKDDSWNHAFRGELRKFREDMDDQVDDQVDAVSDAFNELVPPAKRAYGW